MATESLLSQGPLGGGVSKGQHNPCHLWGGGGTKAGMTQKGLHIRRAKSKGLRNPCRLGGPRAENNQTI